MAFSYFMLTNSCLLHINKVYETRLQNALLALLEWLGVALTLGFLEAV